MLFPNAYLEIFSKVSFSKTLSVRGVLLFLFLSRSLYFGANIMKCLSASVVKKCSDFQIMIIATLYYAEPVWFNLIRFTDIFKGIWFAINCYEDLAAWNKILPWRLQLSNFKWHQHSFPAIIFHSFFFLLKENWRNYILSVNTQSDPQTIPVMSIYSRWWSAF